MKVNKTVTNSRDIAKQQTDKLTDNITCFYHLKLEIAFAIPPSNKLKIETSNPAGKGLINKEYRFRWSTVMYQNTKVLFLQLYIL